MKLKLRPSARQERFSRFVMLSGDQALSESLTRNKPIEKFVCRNLEKGPFETMTCLNSSFWKRFQSFLCIQVWKWGKHIFNTSRFSRWQARRTVSQTQAQLIPFLQAIRSRTSLHQHLELMPAYPFNIYFLLFQLFFSPFPHYLSAPFSKLLSLVFSSFSPFPRVLPCPVSVRRSHIHTS